MGSLERFITLTCVFLAAVVLAVTLGNDPGVSSGSPESALASNRAVEDVLGGKTSDPAKVGGPSNRGPANQPEGNSGASKSGANTPSGFRSLDPNGDGQVEAPRPGLLNSPAKPLQEQVKLWPGPDQNDFGQPRILRDVPGLERYPVSGEELAVLSVPPGATWDALAELLYGDATQAEALRLANDATQEPRPGSKVLIPIYSGQMGEVSLDKRPVQVEARGLGFVPAEISSTEAELANRPGNDTGAQPAKAAPEAAQPQAAPIAKNDQQPRAPSSTAAGAEQTPLVGSSQSKTAGNGEAEPKAAGAENPTGASAGNQAPAANQSGLATGSARTYVVAEGDTLSRISERFYGSPNQWRKIWEANQDVLPNPDRLRPKLTLRIP
jgi:nucleoid-associated protein YgaU